MSIPILNKSAKRTKKHSFSYGQIAQDEFVNEVLDIDDGFFLDIGSGIGGLDPKRVLPYYMSNTYGFEKFRRWQGIAIDYDERYIDEAKKFRSCSTICADLMKTSINDVLKQNNAPRKIDYLSFDVDDAQRTVFDNLDFSTYTFKVVTFEHNLYTAFDYATLEVDKELIDFYLESRHKFKNLGYRLLFGNVSAPNFECPFEDWYVNEEIFNRYGHIASENITSVEAIHKVRNATRL